MKFYDKKTHLYFELNPDTKEAKILGTRSKTNFKCVQLPSEILFNAEQYSVVAIGKSAFENHPALESVYLPKTVTVIEAYAFANCLKLRFFESESNKIQIHENAFTNCTAMVLFVAKQIFLQGDNVFQNCSNIRFAKAVFYGKIHQRTFSNCFRLNSLTFGKNIEIESDAFQNCFATVTLMFFGDAKMKQKVVRELNRMKIQCFEGSNLLNMNFKNIKIAYT